MHSVGLAIARGRLLARDSLSVYLTSQFRREPDFKNDRSNSPQDWLDNPATDGFAEVPVG